MTTARTGIPVPLDINRLQEAYRAKELRPTQIVEMIYAEIARRGDDGVWITLADKQAALAQAAGLEEGGFSATLPLWGIPFAVKDNIDIAGLPTTAACAAYAYRPAETAVTVQRLIAAGAILIGKTNLDQFATGLVGVRTPYGVAGNPFHADYIPGGSSSGSAVAVSSGLVSFALGTDTAGSGRVPAGFNNIVGLKPSIGLLSTRGVVPACRSLDCVSIFALTVPDAMTVLQVAAQFDAADAYSCAAPAGWSPRVMKAPAPFRFGIPGQADLTFFGNAAAETLFYQAVAQLRNLGGIAVEIDYAPFAEAAGLLYTSAGTAERTAAIEDFLDTHADELHPVTRQIIQTGGTATGIDVHRLHYQLQALRQRTAAAWQEIDLLLVPTSGTIYRISEVETDPIRLNSNLGYYTNFVNYFDLAALAVPNGFQPDGLPAGVTFIGPRFHEAVLAAIGHAFHANSNLPLGATAHGIPVTEAATGSPYPYVPLAVFGAHMTGQPLNHQLLTLGAKLVGPARTCPDYRFYALNDGTKRPGLLRVGDGMGAKIECEIWRLSIAAFGNLVATVPGPLGIADVLLETGQAVKGFVCEAAAVAAALDITGYGGWRAYLKAPH